MPYPARVTVAPVSFRRDVRTPVGGIVPEVGRGGQVEVDAKSDDGCRTLTTHLTDTVHLLAVP